MPVQRTIRPNRELIEDFFEEVRDPPNVVARALTRHWLLLFLIALAVAALAWVLAATQPRRYQAEAVASVSPVVNQLTQSELLHGIDALERRVVVATVAALASSDTTRRRAIQSVRGDYAIDATVLPSTNLIRITVDGPDPVQVAMIANRIPPLLDEQTRAMYRVYTIAPISAAVVPEAPYRPRVERAVIAGLALGVLLGAAIAYLIDRRRPHRTDAAAPQ